jgi:hypothetical protein
MIDIVFFFIESALGEWDMSVYEGTNHKGEDLETIAKIGTYFQVVFLLINTVLMLNFVITMRALKLDFTTMSLWSYLQS